MYTRWVPVTVSRYSFPLKQLAIRSLTPKRTCLVHWDPKGGRLCSLDILVLLCGWLLHFLIYVERVLFNRSRASLSLLALTLRVIHFGRRDAH